MVLLALVTSGVATSAAAEQLRVSADGRTFETTSGAPFLYLGDTAWELFHKLDYAAADHYLQDRASKGFTVIQAVVLAELDGLRTPNANGDLPLVDMDPTRPNEEYFRHVDAIVERAAELGLFVGMLPTWGDKVPSDNPGAGPVVFNPDNARTYGRFLGERYRDQPIIWILGGDRKANRADARAIWRAMAAGLEEAHGGRQLMTFHPRGGASSSQWFHDDSWLDFNLFQSGHHTRYNRTYQLVAADRALVPTRPVIDGEPAYESIPVRFWEYVDFSRPSRERVPAGVLDDSGFIADESHFREGFFERDDIRVHLYWTLFAGAAGYTYGANAVWQMYSAGDEIAIPAREDWREALRLPGSGDLRHARRLFAWRPLADFNPDQSLIDGPNEDGPSHARGLLSKDGQSALVYVPGGGHVKLRPDRLRATDWRAFVFDPRTGELTAVDEEPSSSRFALPDGRDWILILDASARY